MLLRTKAALGSSSPTSPAVVVLSPTTRRLPSGSLSFSSSRMTSSFTTPTSARPSTARRSPTRPQKTSRTGPPS
ncbi:hypothetical protein CaCOL14_001207 [Colletotrichum acutatum]